MNHLSNRNKVKYLDRLTWKCWLLHTLQSDCVFFIPFAFRMTDAKHYRVFYLSWAPFSCLKLHSWLICRWKGWKPTDFFFYFHFAVLFGEKPTDDTNVELDKQCALTSCMHTPPAASGKEAIVQFSRAGRKWFEIKEVKIQNIDPEAHVKLQICPCPNPAWAEAHWEKLLN